MRNTSRGVGSTSHPRCAGEHLHHAEDIAKYGVRKRGSSGIEHRAHGLQARAGGLGFG